MVRLKLLLSLAIVAVILGPVPPAAAEPATSIAYPSGAVSTRFNGWAFDTCDAPAQSAMTAWKASPYRGIGIYIGGVNRTCKEQLNLTTSWVNAVTKQGWRLIPIYMGRQAPCSTRPNAVKITPSAVITEANAAAQDAVAKAKALGILPGSAIYGDMEHYNASDVGCRSTVLRFLSSWTKELHRLGYMSAVYVHQDSGAKHLAEVYHSTSYARPDAIWIARWDGNPSLINWPTVPNTYWTVGQRAKQYRGDHDETYGGVTINIDSDRFDAPAASVGFSYQITGGVSSRTGPSFNYPKVAEHPAGTTVRVVCQTYGQKIGTTTVWNKLTTGAYVTDYYVNTPSNTTYSYPIPGCSYGYQTTEQLNRRSGPSTAYSIVGKLDKGSMAWVTCQRAGSKVGTTSVWDRLTDGTWVTDYYVANASNTTFSSPIRRC